MVRKSRKSSVNRRGKSSKPSFAVIFLAAVVVIQAVLLIRSYSIEHKPIIKKTSTTARKAPKENILLSEKKLTEPVQPVKNPADPLASVKKPAVPLPSAPVIEKGKIVIIIDDSGYNSLDCTHLSEIGVPITISILPELPYSKKIAECAHQLGKEVMLHLPLEPHVVREQYPSHYFIKTDMSSSQITRRFAEALKSVPHVAGINNHEGSKATEDSRVMYLIFKEMSKKNLFFVDSKVTNKSVCKPLAEKLKLAFGVRDVFLDNHNDRAYIQGQFRELAQKANEQGTAVAIGHARDLSWTVIKEQIRELSAQGHEFITAKDLINSK